MDSNILVGGGILAGILATFFQGFRQKIAQLFSFIFVTVKFNNQKMVKATKTWICLECTPFRIGSQHYIANVQYVQPDEQNQVVAFKTIPEGTSLWFFRKRPFFVHYSNVYQMSITFIRKEFNADQLTNNIVEYFNDMKTKKSERFDHRFMVTRISGSIGKEQTKSHASSDNESKSTSGYELGEMSDDDKLSTIPLRWNRDQLGLPANCGSIDLLSLHENVISAYKEALRWQKSEKWIKSRKIPWKRGWLVSGKPGTGKTAFVRALGQELDLPIFSFDLSTMNNLDFVEGWSQATSKAPCIALFEDIDGIFNGRENTSCKGTLERGLSFDCFLNVLDGVENTDGVFKIITTNDISKIDPALGVCYSGDEMSSRPGRIDRVIEFLPLDSLGKLKMANRIFNGIDKNLWEHLLEVENQDTGAQFQERCCRLAMKLFWDGVDDSLDREME